MENNDIVTKKIDLAKQRVQKALQEYALNIALLKEKIEWKDLTEFLTVWQEEYNSQAASLEGKDKLFHLS